MCPPCIAAQDDVEDVLELTSGWLRKIEGEKVLSFRMGLLGVLYSADGELVFPCREED